MRKKSIKSRGGWKDYLLIGRTIGVFLGQQFKLDIDESDKDSFTYHDVGQSLSRV
jgi:hypothetical protein